jgi:hypothetical protein
MLKDRCYLVKCFSEDRCQALPARGVDFSFGQKMAFVAPWLFEKNKKIGMYSKMIKIAKIVQVDGSKSVMEKRLY